MFIAFRPQSRLAGSRFVRVSAATALAAFLTAAAAPVLADPLPPAFIYGIDNGNDIYEIDPVAKTPPVLVLSQAVTEIKSNSLAYDITREDLFFIGPDFKLKYWSRTTGSTVSDVGTSPIVTIDPNNAAYYDNAYWYFDFNSNVLNKVSLSYSGSGTGAVPSISGTTSYAIAGMDLPNPGSGLNTNTFGDIAIDVPNGILYASTARGRFYSVNLNGDPTNTFTQLAPAIANDNTLGLQLSFNSDFSVLYGHSYETGDWYEVGLADGARTSLDYATLPFEGKGFRDLGGAAIVPEPSSLALLSFGAAGLGWRLLRRRQTA